MAGSRSLGTLTIDLVAKTAGFEQGMDKAARSTDKRMKEINRKAKAIGAAIGVAAAAAATAVAVWTKQTIEAAAQVDRLAQLSNASTTVFQRWATGASMVGIEQDKLADILKDTQDKVGDFIQTGGGAMADFFEQIAPRVGVTAEQFRKLSGPDALQLYVNSLQKANLSQSDMVFYMEAIASDSSLLLPLLKDNAAGMKEYGDMAERLGAVMSNDLINSADMARVELKKLDLVKQGLINRIVEGVLPALTNMTSKLVGAAEKTAFLDKVARVAVTGMKLLSTAGVIVGGIFKTLGEALGGIAATVVQLIQGHFRQAFETYKAANADVVANVKGTVAAVQGIWDDTEIKATPIADAAKTDTRLAQRIVKDGGKKVVSEAEKIYQRVEEAISRIRRDLATFGMSPEEVKLFDLQEMGATPEQLQRAKSALDQLRLQQDDKDLYEERQKQEADMAARYRDTMQAIAEQRELVRLSADDQEVWNNLKWAGAQADTELGRAVIETTRKLQQEREQIIAQVQAMDAVRDAGKGLFKDLADGKNPLQAIEDALDRIRERITDMIAERLIDRLFGKQGDPGGGSSGDWLGSLFGALFGGGKASGGTALPNTLYEINERGFETASVGGKDYMLTGDRPVQITPHEQLVSPRGATLTQQFIVQGVLDNRTASQMAGKVGTEARRSLARNGR